MDARSPITRKVPAISINTTRREMFYWAAVLATFAMGTAVGDMSAYTMHLGWFTSGLTFTVIFAIPMVARALRTP